MDTQRERRRAQRWASIAATCGLLALVVAPWESTSRKDDVATSTDGPSSTVGAPGADGAGGSSTRTADGSGGPGATAVTVPGAGGPGTTSGSTDPGATSAPATGSPGGPVANGIGVTDTEIRVGIIALDNVDVVASAYGHPELAVGDMRAQAQAVIDHINATGGIRGRHLVANIQGLDVTGADYAVQEQAMCSRWTEDDQVFAGIAAHGGVSSMLVACMAQHRTAMIAQAQAAADQQFVEEHRPYFVSPALPTITRFVKPYVDGLAASGYFDGCQRVGLYRQDSPEAARASADVLGPALASHGVALAYEEAINVDSVSEQAQRLPGLVLRFQQRDIDCVVTFIDIIQFADVAASLGYFPRYALHSAAAPQLFAEGGNRQSLRGAVGVGWAPTLDVRATEDPGPTPARARCYDIMRDAGVRLPSRLSEFVATTFCDYLFILREALDMALALTPEAFAATVEQLGTAHDSAVAFSTRFAPGRLDGAASSRTFAFDEACGCFRYTGDPVSWP